ncbi:MAG: NAD(P)-dependent malic enzyme [Symbiobacteriia bacterium]
MAVDQAKRLDEEALELHRRLRGKLAVVGKVEVRDMHDLALAYSPGVAAPCRRISANRDDVYDYTMKGNLVAVVTDGTSVLGLGDIGPAAAIPVVEGKALLFKTFAGVDAFPICLDTTNVDEIVATVEAMAPVFGGINLEDIAAPRCFVIEQRLKESLDIPVFHDDQHGTAIVVGAGLINAAKVVGKAFGHLNVVVGGAGAAATSVSRLLLTMGVQGIILCDTRGAIYEGRAENMNPYKEEIARVTNRARRQGRLADVLAGADVFIGLSRANQVTREMVRAMAPDPILFAMANPVPEIMPEEALAAGAAVVGTGRSDYPNQVNNVLAFPGVFRGALDVRAREINEAMKHAAARAIAALVATEELSQDHVIPQALDRRVAPAVAAAVARAALDTGVARIQVSPQEVAEHCRQLVSQQVQ